MIVSAQNQTFSGSLSLFQLDSSLLLLVSGILVIKLPEIVTIDTDTKPNLPGTNNLELSLTT